MALITPTRWLSAIIVCWVAPAALTGCGIAGSARPQAAAVVASTDVWGSVARAVTGSHIAVKSILSGADEDPHS
jgi:zinc/manganese transport system substrate-binding protein